MPRGPGGATEEAVNRGEREESGKTVELKITTEVLHRGRWFVARCPELDIASQEASAEEAKRHVTPDNLRQPPTLAR